jgi:hypothetical protein
MSIETEIDAPGYDEDERPEIAATAMNEPQGAQKKPEAALTSDVIERGKNWARAYLTGELDAPVPEMPPAPPITPTAQDAPDAARLLRADLPSSESSFWSGALVFAIVYLVGFIAIVAALDLFPDMIQFMFGPQGAPPVK